MCKKNINIHQENKKIIARIFWDFYGKFLGTQGCNEHARGYAVAK
jgi:hypothetical protein